MTASPKYQKGKAFLWTSHVGPIKVRVVGQSDRTGEILVEVVEGVRCYKAGAKIQLKPWELIGLGK